jgi:CubicO group peptidase (beta-lactamase class C family)
VSDDFERTTARLVRELDEGLFTRGAQVAVEVGGERVLDLALGDAGTGVRMDPDHVLRVYCTIKPVTAVTVARLVDRGVLHLDEPLEKRLPHVRALTRGVTLRHVLTHTAGLHTLSGIRMEMVRPEVRREMVERLLPPPGFRVGVDAAYSEYAGWHVLGWLLEDVTGEPLRRHLRTAVLEPLGLDSTWVGMTPEEYEAVFPRLGVNHEMRHLESFPMLFERSERVCLETNPAHGGYTTARDLARFYTALLDRLGGQGSDSLPSRAVLEAFCSPARPPVYDEVLDRVCSYGLGFMTSLDQHAFGDRCSAESFGHSGNVGASFGFADPERALAVGVVFNGLVAYEAAFLRRRALLNSLYADLDGQAAPREEHVASVGGERTRRTRLGGWLRRHRQ